jgi:hypothetical protein
VSATEHEQLPPIATIPDVVEALRLLGVGVGVDESVPGVKVGLAYSAVGAAERNAAGQPASCTGAESLSPSMSAAPSTRPSERPVESAVAISALGTYSSTWSQSALLAQGGSRWHA